MDIKSEEGILDERKKVEEGYVVEKVDNNKNHESKKPYRTVRLSLAIIGMVVGVGFGFYVGANGIGAYTGKLDYSELDEVYSEIVRNFDGEIVESDLIAGAKKGMVEGLGDPYSQIFTYNETEEFYDDMSGEFEGIGIEMINRDGMLTIVDTLSGTPAEEVGLMANDLIYKVDDYETLEWASEAAVKVIRGEKGTNVKITVIRNGEALEFDITRDTINNPSVKWEIVDGIGVLEISRFGENDTVRLARQAADEFVAEGVKGVVLDLRGNGGGYVNAASEVASLWMEPGQVVTVEKKGNFTISESKSNSTNTLRGIKTVVLVDGGSASAAEILAGALQDHELAAIVGSESYGKGSVQTLLSLRGGDSLKLTIAKWYTPDGRNFDESGIMPDYEIKFDSESYKTDGTDNQLEKAKELVINP